MDVVIVQVNKYVTPTVPAVIFWLTNAPEADAEPEMMALGLASVPLYTVAATAWVLIVSPAASWLVKSKVRVCVEPLYLLPKVTRLSMPMCTGFRGS